MDIKYILCPADFSDASAHAIEQATAIAGWYKARIAALHVLSPMFLMVPGIAPAGDRGIEERERERVRREATARFAGAVDAGVPVDVLIDVGHPAERILDRAKSLPADLIVMGTHGASGFEHLVLGSATEKVLRKAACPVLTVPPRAQTTARLPFRRVLCAVDFSDSSLTALASAVSLAEASNAELTLLHVIEWPWQEPPPPTLEALPPEPALALAEYRRYSEATAKTRLESLIPASSRLSRPPVARLRDGKAYVQILDVAQEEGSDLIVMGVRGRSALDLAVFGSTTNQVVRRASCPVLTLRR